MRKMHKQESGYARFAIAGPLLAQYAQATICEAASPLGGAALRT